MIQTSEQVQLFSFITPLRIDRSVGITSRKDRYTSKYKTIYYDPDIEAAERSGKREFRDLFTICYVFFTWIMFGLLIGWFIAPKCDADGKN